MIISGYQGIGKSTLGGVANYIDLESGNFWVDGKRADDWYKAYCQIAEHLSYQGYVVFVSSHKPVREELENSEENVYVICPSLDLKDEWIEKLRNRYEETGLDKDYRALVNAEERYDENITELINGGLECVIIDNMDYSLPEMIMRM